jgi:hypothetical protein
MCNALGIPGFSLRTPGMDSILGSGNLGGYRELHK